MKLEFILRKGVGGKSCFIVTPSSSPHPLQIHSQKLQQWGGEGRERGGGGKSAYDYELNFEPSLLFLPRILECEGKGYT